MRPSHVGPLHPGSFDTSKSWCRGPVYEPPGTSKRSQTTWLARPWELQTRPRWTSSNSQCCQVHLNRDPSRGTNKARSESESRWPSVDPANSSYLRRSFPQCCRAFRVQSTTATSVRLLFPRVHIWRPDSIIPFVFWQRISGEGERGEKGG